MIRALADYRNGRQFWEEEKHLIWEATPRENGGILIRKLLPTQWAERIKSRYEKKDAVVWKL